jgi:uncharacterized protein YkuJ
MGLIPKLHFLFKIDLKDNQKKTKNFKVKFKKIIKTNYYKTKKNIFIFKKKKNKIKNKK